METDKTILTREVVSLDDRKRLGKIKGICIDVDKRAVSHYILGSASTSSDLVLPFENTLAVGDTFLTVQSSSAILATVAPEATKALQDGYKLIDVEVFTRTGNRMGNIKSFDFDPVYGTIASIALGDKTFDASSFVFFSPEFVFVDDGTPTASELRSSGADESVSTISVAAEPAEAEAAAPAVVEEIAEEKPAAAPAAVEPTPEPEPEPAPVAAPVEEASDGKAADDEVATFLIGMVISDDVESADGAFSVSRGTTLTEEIVAEAKKHDALLLLTMCVDV